MDQANRQNLTINGSGSSGGGYFNKIRIRGEGTIVNDFDSSLFKTHGTCELLGSAKVELMEIFGTAEARKDLQGNELKVYGTMNIGGDVDVKKVKIRGTIDVRGRFTGDTTDIKGSLNVKGDCEIESFALIGAFEINGLLNAGIINVSLKYATSEVKEIGGEKINIRRSKPFFNLPFGKSGGELTTDIIEGDDIYLEYTKAKIVRGNNVEIGPGCEIGLVEYKQNLKNESNSEIKDVNKI